MNHLPRIERGTWRRQKRRLLEALAQHGWTTAHGTFIPDALQGLMKALVPGWTAHQPPYSKEVVDYIINEVLGWAEAQARADVVLAYAEGRMGGMQVADFGSYYNARSPLAVYFASAYRERLSALASQSELAKAREAVAHARALELAGVTAKDEEVARYAQEIKPQVYAGGLPRTAPAPRSKRARQQGKGKRR